MERRAHETRDSHNYLFRNQEERWSYTPLYPE